MDVEALEQELRQCLALMRSIADTEPPPGAGPDWDLSREEVARFDRAEARANEIRQQLNDAEGRRGIIMSRSSSGVHGDDRGTFSINRSAADAWDADTIRMDASAADLRARLEAGLDRDSNTPDDVKQGALHTLRSVVGDRRGLALRCLLTGSDDYRAAFGKMACGQQALWTDRERAAMARAQAIGSGGAGAYAVPFTLDPTIVLTNASAINPIRNIARIVTTNSNAWQGVTTAGVTASWDAEGAEVSDDSMTLVQPSIPVFKGQAFVPFSVEIEGDWAGIESDLRMAFNDARDRLEAAAHITGNGTSAPTGIQTELDGGSSEIGPLTAETFAAGDVYALQRALGARYRPNAQWVGAIGTFNKIRQFDTGGGGSFWTSLGDGMPERLLGWPAHEASEVDDWYDLDAAATADNFLLFVGDWSKYVIVDRVGMTVELVPHLFHTGNNRPSGQRGLIAWWRTGAELIDDNAIVTLSIPTAA